MSAAQAIVSIGLHQNDGRYAQVRSERSGEDPEAVGTHPTLMELTRRRSHLLAK